MVALYQTVHFSVGGVGRASAMGPGVVQISRRSGIPQIQWHPSPTQLVLLDGKFLVALPETVALYQKDNCLSNTATPRYQIVILVFSDPELPPEKGIQFYVGADFDRTTQKRSGIWKNV